MDQFFTKDEVAARCLAWLKEQVELPEDAHWVEPSVGRGAFYRLLPADRRTGFELDPALARAQGLEPQDFLGVLPLESPLPDRPLVFVGNPPFGHRARLAAAFVNHCFALGAEYVAMIVPPMLVPSIVGGQQAGKTCDSFVSVKRIAPKNSPKSARWIGKCDLYYRKSEYLAKDIRFFEDYEEGYPVYKDNAYGIIIHKDKAAVKKYLTEDCDWKKFAKRSVANQFNLAIDAVKRAIIAGGFIDEGRGGAGPAAPYLQPPDAESMIEGGYSIGVYEELDQAYELPEGGTKDIPHCGFVLYRKGGRPGLPAGSPCSSYVALMGIGHYKERDERDQAKIARCDCFLPAATQEGHREGCRLMVYPGRMNAIGLELLKDKERLYAWLRAYDWAGAAKRSTNRNLLLNRHIVQQAVVEGGFVDGVPQLRQGSVKEVVRCRQVDIYNGTGLHMMETAQLFIERNKPEGSFLKRGIRVSRTCDWKQAIAVEVLQKREGLVAWLEAYDWNAAVKRALNGYRRLTIARVEQAVQEWLDGLE